MDAYDLDIRGYPELPCWQLTRREGITSVAHENSASGRWLQFLRESHAAGDRTAPTLRFGGKVTQSPPLWR